MSEPARLDGVVALVTGASRGVGRGVAAELARLGAAVYGSARTITSADLPPEVRRVACDHTDDAAVSALFERVRAESGRLDLLVNAAWGGYERMVVEGRFTWSDPFWEQPLWRWEAMMDAGVRAAYTASREAARLMVPAGSGLVVLLSHWAARKHVGNVIYGVAKAATDKLAFDMAVELRPHGVAALSLYPGLVRTESVLASEAFDLSNSESPEFIGRVIAGLLRDEDLLERSGGVCVAAAVAEELGIDDVDGTRPRPLTLEEA